MSDTVDPKLLEVLSTMRDQLEHQNDELAELRQQVAANRPAPAAPAKATWTRAEIGKLSPEEFSRNKPSIMDALRNGTITDDVSGINGANVQHIG